MYTFGERLRILRIINGLTQKSLAEAFNITERAYQRYEYNASTPNYHALIHIADYFNVSLDYLVGRSNNPNISK